MAIVYKTTNLINGKMYIGVDSKNNTSYLGSGKMIKRAIKKYGFENFKKEIIKKFEKIEDAYEYEKMIINKLNATDSKEYYNISEGGKGGWSHIKTAGIFNPMYNKSVKDITIEKYGEQEGLLIYQNSRKKAGIATSKKLKGVSKSEKHKESLSISKKKFWNNLTEEDKEKRRAEMSNNMKSACIVRSDEYKKKMSESLKKKSDKIHKKIECTKCGKKMNAGNLKRWHGDKCKQK